MPALKVTQRGIEALLNKPHPRQIDYRDTLTTGLVFRIGPRGGVWNYLRRVDGKLHRIKLGRWPSMTIKDAREAVADLEQAIVDGKHPQAEQARREAARQEQREADQALLLERVISDWRAVHFPALAARTRRDYQAPLAEFEQAFAGRLVNQIKRGELIQHMDRVKARSAAQANRTAVILRQLFAYASDRHDLEHNPAATLKTPARPSRRKRTLSRSEIRLVWRAAELASYPYGHALRFALCTGQRIGEVGSLKWSAIDGDYWSNTETKTGQRIDIYLAGHARGLLDTCLRIGDYVFTASGKTGIRSDTWSGALARHIRPKLKLAAAELGVTPDMPHWTAHDLRRTVRTGLTGWAGVSPDTAERVLNHSISGVRAHYDFADYRPHVAEALRAWDGELGRILDGLAPVVVPLRRVAP